MQTRAYALLSWLVVTAGAAVALKAADRVPALLAGTPHGARSYRTVSEAERATGVRLWLPASLPSDVDWPPFRIDAWPGPPVSVALRANATSESRERLVIVQSIGTPTQPPSVLLEPLQALLVTHVPVGRRAGVLTRGLEPSGRLVHDLAWDAGARRVTIRYAGPVEELLQLAAGLERNGQ